MVGYVWFIVPEGCCISKTCQTCFRKIYIYIYKDRPLCEASFKPYRQNLPLTCRKLWLMPARSSSCQGDRKFFHVLSPTQPAGCSGSIAAHDQTTHKDWPSATAILHYRGPLCLSNAPLQMEICYLRHPPTSHGLNLQFLIFLESTF